MAAVGSVTTPGPDPFANGRFFHVSGTMDERSHRTPGHATSMAAAAAATTTAAASSTLGSWASMPTVRGIPTGTAASGAGSVPGSVHPTGPDPGAADPVAAATASSLNRGRDVLDLGKLQTAVTSQGNWTPATERLLLYDVTKGLAPGTAVSGSLFDLSRRVQADERCLPQAIDDPRKAARTAARPSAEAKAQEAKEGKETKGRGGDGAWPRKGKGDKVGRTPREWLLEEYDWMEYFTCETPPNDIFWGQKKAGKSGALDLFWLLIQCARIMAFCGSPGGRETAERRVWPCFIHDFGLDARNRTTEKLKENVGYLRVLQLVDVQNSFVLSLRYGTARGMDFVVETSFDDCGQFENWLRSPAFLQFALSGRWYGIGQKHLIHSVVQVPRRVRDNHDKSFVFLPGRTTQQKQLFMYIFDACFDNGKDGVQDFVHLLRTYCVNKGMLVYDFNTGKAEVTACIKKVDPKRYPAPDDRPPGLVGSAASRTWCLRRCYEKKHGLEPGSLEEGLGLGPDLSAPFDPSFGPGFSGAHPSVHGTAMGVASTALGLGHFAPGLCGPAASVLAPGFLGGPAAPYGWNAHGPMYPDSRYADPGSWERATMHGDYWMQGTVEPGSWQQSEHMAGHTWAYPHGPVYPHGQPSVQRYALDLVGQPDWLALQGQGQGAGPLDRRDPRLPHRGLSTQLPGSVELHGSASRAGSPALGRVSRPVSRGTEGSVVANRPVSRSSVDGRGTGAQPGSQLTTMPGSQPTRRPESRPEGRPSSQGYQGPGSLALSRPSSRPVVRPSSRPSGQPATWDALRQTTSLLGPGLVAPPPMASAAHREQMHMDRVLSVQRLWEHPVPPDFDERNKDWHSDGPTLHMPAGGGYVPGPRASRPVSRTR